MASHHYSSDDAARRRRLPTFCGVILSGSVGGIPRKTIVELQDKRRELSDGSRDGVTFSDKNDGKMCSIHRRR
jgi:hypothetical protein